jgi:hypothetical protein
MEASSLDTGRPASASCPVQPVQDAQASRYGSSQVTQSTTAGQYVTNGDQPGPDGQPGRYSAPVAQQTPYCHGTEAGGQEVAELSGYSLVGLEEERQMDGEQNSEARLGGAGGSR